jgi:hypothetical protein
MNEAKETNRQLAPGSMRLLFSSPLTAVRKRVEAGVYAGFIAQSARGTRTRKRAGDAKDARMRCYNLFRVGANRGGKVWQRSRGNSGWSGRRFWGMHMRGLGFSVAER